MKHQQRNIDKNYGVNEVQVRGKIKDFHYITFA